MQDGVDVDSDGYSEMRTCIKRMKRSDVGCCDNVKEMMPEWEESCLADHCTDGKRKTCVEEATDNWNAILAAMKAQNNPSSQPGEDDVVDPLVEGDQKR